MRVGIPAVRGAIPSSLAPTISSGGAKQAYLKSIGRPACPNVPRNGWRKAVGLPGMLIRQIRPICPIRQIDENENDFYSACQYKVKFMLVLVLVLVIVF